MSQCSFDVEKATLSQTGKQNLAKINDISFGLQHFFRVDAQFRAPANKSSERDAPVFRYLMRHAT
jgi:hypothetical protein